MHAYIHILATTNLAGETAKSLRLQFLRIQLNQQHCSILENPKKHLQIKKTTQETLSNDWSIWKFVLPKKTSSSALPSKCP